MTMFGSAAMYLYGLGLAHTGCNVERGVVVVELSHRAQLDAFLVVQKDLVNGKYACIE